MKIHLIRLAVFVGVTVAVVRASATGALAQDKSDKADPQAAVIHHLRAACVANADLHGVLIKDAELDKAKKALVLQGLVDGKEQRKALAREAARLLKNTKWEEAYAGGVIVDRLADSPLKSKYLGMLKTDFAAKDADRTLAQTRLDDLHYQHSSEGWRLVVSGVCIAEKDPNEVKGLLERRIAHLVRKEYAADELRDVKFEVVAEAMMFERPLPKFRAAFLKSNMNTIFIQDANYDAAGVLQLQGIVSKADVERCEKFFKRDLAQEKAVASGCSFKSMQAIDWPLDVKKWNQGLLREALDDVQKLHILRAYFESPDQIVCDATTLETKTDENQAAVSLKKALAGTWKKDWQKYYPKAEITANVIPLANAKPDLQRALLEAGLKRTLVTGLGFDADGSLVIAGLTGSQAEHDAVARHLDAAALAGLFGGGKAPVGLREQDWDAKFHAKAAVSLKNLAVVDWDGKIKQFQKKLSAAAATNTMRLDDIYFTRGKATAPEKNDDDKKKDDAKTENAGDLQIVFSGITLREDVAKKLFAEECKNWPEVNAAIGERGVIADFKFVAVDQPKLQGWIEKVATFDGIFIDPAMVFDEAGKLVLTGKWRTGSDDEKARIQAILDNEFSGDALAPQKNGIVYQLKPAPTRELLSDLQIWVQNNKNVEDTFVERLYYDKTGNLALQFLPVPSKDKPMQAKNQALIEKELRRLIKLKAIELRLPADQKLLPFPPAPAGPEQKKKAAPDTTENFAPRQAFVSAPVVFSAQKGDDDLPLPPAEHLRQKVIAKSEFWDGVLLERGYFDAKGNYRLAGLVDNATQIDRLEKELREMAAQPDWRPALANRLDAKELRRGLRVMPLRPMLEALMKAMPEYEELDQIRLSGRAYHAVDKKLVLVGFTTIDETDKAAAKERRAEAGDKFADLLRAHPDWRERVVAGLELNLATVKQNRNIAALASDRAFEWLVDELADPVNPPGQSYASYVWAQAGCTPVVLVYARPGKAGDSAKKLPPRDVLVRCIHNLDVTLFHAPDDSGAWFLRAACYAAAKDEASALRDLRRMNKIEMDNESAQRKRLAEIERFQGYLRQLTIGLSQQALVDIGAGNPPRSLEEIARLIK